ncbi:MAG: RcnB family protein [Polaromonas sp.]|nr:RcnB family protein [Polaromonas sp.]
MRSKRLESFLIAMLLGASAVALAAKPEWAGQAGPKAAKPPAQARPEIPIGAHFQDQQRQAVARYYGGLQAKGRCPPGLAKKNNGCMPPGQAKKWSRGQPLPASLIQYPVPRGVISQIGQPPAGHKYVRVANDLLLVALGTMMVVDAIEDLMKP